KLSSVSGRPSFQSEKRLSSLRPRRRFASAVRLMVMLTRGVCRAIPRFFAIALAEVTTPLAIRPDPPSFSLAKTKMVSPLAMCLPPYIVFCAVNANVCADGSLTSALIANIRRLFSHLVTKLQCAALVGFDLCQMEGDVCLELVEEWKPITNQNRQDGITNFV